jgi:hypothetical protein
MMLATPFRRVLVSNLTRSGTHRIPSYNATRFLSRFTTSLAEIVVQPVQPVFANL